MELSLAGKTAIITGAGSGAGAAIAKRCAAAGANVAINDLNPDKANQVAQEIEEAGGTAAAVPADVGNKFQCVHLVESVRERWGRLDMLVTAAGIQPSGSILRIDEWEWNRCLEVNLKGTFFMSQLVGRVMADENQEKGGSILHIINQAGIKTPAANQAIYGVSNAGILAFSRECAREYAPYNIRVNALLLPPKNAQFPIKQVTNLALFLCSENAETFGTHISIPTNV